MTGPFIPQVSYSALKLMIKYQTLSMQVSDVGGFEHSTAYISRLTLHSTIMKQQRPCLVIMAPAQWHEIIHIFGHFELILRRKHVFQNFFFWQCQLQCKQSCQKFVHCHAHAELFCIISLHGERTQCPIAIVLFCSFGLNFICCLRLLGYHLIK